MANPLIPVWFDLAWRGFVLGALVLLVLALVLLVLALVQIARTSELSSTGRAIWVLIVLFVPIVGPVVWFSIGRRSLVSASQFTK